MIHTYRVSTLKQYKYGIELPQSYKHALELDRQNGNTKWSDAIRLKISQMIDQFKAFSVVPKGKTLSSDFKRLRYHFVFDIKFDGRHKARWVMDGNFTPAMPREECFALVVLTEAVRLGFVLAQIYDLQCIAGDVGNAFLTAYTSEKIYIVAGPEFGELEGSIMKMEKAVYGTKTAALRFHESLLICLQKIGFRPSEAEPDFWY
jgi:hypothetical protein